MAIYHCNVKIISRSSGRTAVASAAYRSGDRLYSQYTGETSDYSRKGWIEYTNIFLPDNAPRQYYDRETLWNAVEASEKAPDAQVAREVEVALPAELSKEQQEQLAEAFVRDQFVSRGMIADVCIHRPPVTDDRHRPLDKDGRITKDPDKMIFINPHAHILLTMRPLDDHGKWQPKTKKEYKCIRDGVEKGFTADEFDQAKEHGWEKQYKYQFGPSTKWFPESEAESLQLQKVSRDPKTTHGGRHNPIVAEWNNPERVKEWRKAWEEAVNRSLEQAGLSERVDCRSFKDQGIDLIPQIHVGSAATALEKRIRRLGSLMDKCDSILAERAALNREIKRLNEEYLRSRKKLVNKTWKKPDLLQQYTAALHIIYSLDKHQKKRAVISASIKTIQNTRKQFIKLKEQIAADDAKSEEIIRKLEKESRKLGILQGKQREEFRTKIDEQNKAILYRKEHFNKFLISAGISGHDPELFKKNELDALKQAEAALSDSIARLEGERDALIDKITDSFNEQIRKGEDTEDMTQDLFLEAEKVINDLESDPEFDRVSFETSANALSDAIGIGVDTGLEAGTLIVRETHRLAKKAGDDDKIKRSR